MCIAAAAADSQPSDVAAAILRSDIEQTADGYNYKCVLSFLIIIHEVLVGQWSYGTPKVQ